MFQYIVYVIDKVSRLSMETGITDELIGNLFPPIFTGIITIIGFAVTYFSMKKSFKDELQKQNNEVKVEKLSDLSDKFLRAIRVCSKALSDKSLSDDDTGNIKVGKKFFEQYDAAVADLILYGTDEMISVMYFATKMESSIDSKKHRLVLIITALMLIFAMIRHEFTDAMTSPENYFIIILSNYVGYFDLFKKYNNEIVTGLKLNKKYLIM